MGEYVDYLKLMWLWMLEAPWRHSGPDSDREVHWLYWSVGWGWALSGVVLGALVAPTIVRWAGLSNTQYQDWFVIVVAVLAGFLVQLLGWCALGLVLLVNVQTWATFLEVLTFWVICALPVASVGFGIYRYLTWVGAGQRSVTVAFVGALLIKTFAIPFIKGLVTGAIFKAFMNWLRGDKAKAKGA